MLWKHRCSFDWLIERKKHISASEIKHIVPYTASGNPRKVTARDYMRVYASQRKILTKDDCFSVGAAARGHILEPYAIDAFNRSQALRKEEDPSIPYCDVELHHWDDVVVQGTCRSLFDVAFSPDAMDIEQTSDEPYQRCDPKVIGEVKCYSTDKHLEKLTQSVSEMEERWQIAAAMYACESIELAVLIFYDPSILINQIGYMFVTREDLEEEIMAIGKAAAEYERYLLTAMKSKSIITDSFGVYESEIHSAYEEKCRMDPWM